MDSLPELRDIHLPLHDVSVWPLANGWWVIIATFVALYILIKVVLWLRCKSAKIYARRILNNLNMQNYIAAAAKMSELLRRVCVRRYPEAVALKGEQWLEFLKSKTSHELDARTANLLKDAPFIPENSDTYGIEDVQNLRSFCDRWLGENL
jgi:hypothetical protein